MVLGPASINLQALGDENGIKISELLLKSQTSVVAQAQGSLPIVINPGQTTNVVHLASEKPISFSLETAPETALWRKMEDWFGVDLSEPGISMKVEGTLARPVGHLRALAKQIKLKKAGTTLPSLEDFELNLEMDRSQAKVTEAKLRVQGQPIKAEGVIPLDQEFWANLRPEKITRISTRPPRT